MHSVFNMGIGMAIVCFPEQVAELTATLPEARVIGKVTETEESQRVIIA